MSKSHREKEVWWIRFTTMLLGNHKKCKIISNYMSVWEVMVMKEQKFGVQILAPSLFSFVTASKSESFSDLFWTSVSSSITWGGCAVCCAVLSWLQSCLTLCDPTDFSPPGSSVRGILQVRIPEWVAMSSFRGSSQPRDWTCISWVLYPWATRETP